jgi:hypothetical protein
VREAFIASFLVAIEGAIAGALGLVLLRGSAIRRVAVPVAAAVGAGLMVGLALGLSTGRDPGDLAPALHRTAHLRTLAVAAFALLVRGRTVDDVAAGWRRTFEEAAALATALALLLPEGAFLAAALRDLAVLHGAPARIWAAAAAGVALAAALGAAAASAWGRVGAGRALTPGAVLGIVLALELAGVAGRAVDAHTLPLALTGAISRALHDAVHLVFVLLQVPDHAYLEDWAYQLVLKFLEPAVHAAIGALVASIPIAVAWRAFARRPLPPADPAARPPERRLVRARALALRRLGAVPFAAALVIAVAAIWSARAQGDELYDPVPEPVVDDGAGHIVVPLAGPLGGGGDRMRKWIYAAGKRAVTFFTIRRPDGSLAAALDVCEICRPKGYAQMGDGYVFCKYCKTPIPTGTVGQPGGCNPIPIPGATLRGSVLLLPRDGVVAAWERRMSGER